MTLQKQLQYNSFKSRVERYKNMEKKLIEYMDIISKMGYRRMVIRVKNMDENADSTFFATIDNLLDTYIVLRQNKESEINDYQVFKNILHDFNTQPEYGLSVAYGENHVYSICW